MVLQLVESCGRLAQSFIDEVVQGMVLVFRIVESAHYLFPGPRHQNRDVLVDILLDLPVTCSCLLSANVARMAFTRSSSKRVRGWRAWY